jgi:hypothetical protein
MNDKRHKEFRVLTLKNGKPDKKELTERGHVMITDRDREVNNGYVKSRRMWYELDEPVKKTGRPKKQETKTE